MARWFRTGISGSDPFGCRCLTSRTMLRFHFPLIEPDGRISRIRLSDMDSRDRCRAQRCLKLLNLFRVGRLIASRRRSRALSCVVHELRSLRSTGITRLRRYYEPLRHPTRPESVPRGLSVDGHAPSPLGLPVVAAASFGACRRHYPGGTAGTIGRFPNSCGGGFPRVYAGSASTSNFSRPARRSLALRPAPLRSR